jgi:hypothetical protein
MLGSLEEFLARLSSIKNDYESGVVKLNALPMFTMVMAGVFDSWLTQPVSVEDRMGLMRSIRDALKSTASFQSSKSDLTSITSELERRMWLTQVNPAFSFRISDQYTEAMKVMGYTDTGKPNMRFRKDREDIFSNFPALFSDNVVNFYSNPHVARIAGIIVSYKGFQTLPFARGKYIKASFFDGTEEFKATVWPKYGTPDTFDGTILNPLKSYRNRVCIILGKPSVSKGGFKNFAIHQIKLLG